MASAALQENINRFVDKSASWNLRINPRKCAVIRFTHRSSNIPTIGNSPYSVNNSILQFTEKHPDLGIKTHNSLKFHEHIRSKVNAAGALTSNLLSSTVCRDPEFIISLYTSHVRPMLEYGSQVWNMGYIGDTQMIESIQRRWTRAIPQVGHLDYGDRLQALNLYSMAGRLLRADLIYVWRMFNNKCALKPGDFFQPSLSQTTRGHSHKLQVQRSRLECLTSEKDFSLAG